MNSLTFCLITMGRQQFISPLVESLDRILGIGDFRILVILNGAPAEIAQTYLSWGEKHPNKVEILMRDMNDAGIASFLPIITQVETDWICFPGDDDVLDATFFSNWESIAREYTDYGAIATALNLIDSRGKFLGIRKAPSFNLNFSFIENAAKSFSECPFLWPGLIIRVNQIPTYAPSTRYVSDWWIGMNLIFGSKVHVISDSFLNYRVHELQESQVSSFSRKNFEALEHLGAFVSSETFTTWIRNLQSKEVVDFLEFLIKYPPLYSDTKFSSELVSIITKHVESIRSEPEIRRVAIYVNALAHNVLIHESQLRYISASIGTKDNELFGFNFNLIVDKLSCPKIKAIQTHNSANFPQLPTLIIGCLHSSKKRNTLVLDCINLNGEPQIIDCISQLATDKFTKLGIFQATVSQFEYSLIKKFRNFKYVLPSRLTKILYSIFRK